ncbi:Zinc finger, CCHC-type [Rhizoctonia solani]|uniref:Zinc finger, CCHC-type n=1 Tax=Rhizoctonia solani TaxID=456999 RepID=A0A8H8SRQ7_9AGAM|nr:Zinc finger, CCHC-type [Rhizoctonia solani]QRW15819.1 Zinc finger, CCHC-type [Rhizoctonia solani]
MPGLGKMGETNLTPSQIQLGWSAPSSRTHTPAPVAVPPHVYSLMSFDQMLDCKLLDMVAQNMIVLKKEFLQLQGAYEAQGDQLALLRAELEEHCKQLHNQHIFYSNQIQGAASSIQAVQDQLLHMTTICPTAPPPPPGTATTSNIPPPTSSSNLKFAKPNKFSSKKEDALNFIIACQAYIRAKGANCSHKEKILWVTSYFEGAAEDWVRPYKERKVFRGEAVPLLEDINFFWAEFTKHYVDTNCNEKYCQKWNNLRQKALVQEYTCEFQQYSDIMLSTMFQWRRATAQQVYDKAEEIANHIESTRLSNPLVSTICAPATAVPTSASSPSPTPTCLNVGDNVYMIDPTTHCAKKGAITSIVCTTSGNMPNVRWNGETKDTMIPFPSLKKDERPAAAAPVKPIVAPVPVLASNSKGPGPMDLDGRGFTNLTCHVCGGKGHFARNCPSKPMSGHVANIEWSWERPKEENWIEVVSDEEELGKGKAKAN